MNVLLLSMPDSFEHMAPVAVRMPNGALTSLAGNVDPQHHVAVADLILVQGRVAATVDRLLDAHAPDVVGLSVMTFQRRTALKLIQRIRARRPSARIVVGGYDPSLASHAYEAAADVVVRGEGEITFRELLRAIETRRSFDGIAGLGYRDGEAFRYTAARPVSSLDEAAIAPPRRDARVLGGYTLLGRPVDVIETSRGCTFDCSFCSIIEMRGRNFHTYDFTRILDDIRDCRDRGARALFIVDDNITLDVKRFAALCQAIVDAGLHDLEYAVQATTASIADHGATLAPLMRRAGFRYVFLGIENVLDADLGFLKASAKNTKHEKGGRRAGNATLTAIEHLHAHGLFVVGGLIVGNPGDTREAIEANLAFARQHVDWPYIQHPTPYPGTPMTTDLRAQGLVINDRLEEYDGTTAVVRTEAVPAEEIEFLRWRAERWMKLRHFPKALRHSPLFCLRHGPAMIRHVFRGASPRTWFSRQPARAAFARYRRLRALEREYV
jgi:anaerobic magnesium-protoporphyrin IX monomethyl ester cyclase